MNRVLVPPRTRVFRQGEWFLYFDPYNFTWVRVNESGRFLIEQFRKYRTVEQVIGEVGETFDIAEQEARTAVDDFVQPLVESGFLHSERYRENERFEFAPREFAYAIYLHLTNDCNLKCPYCYNKSDREFKIELQKKGRFAPILTTDEYKALLDRIVSLGAKHLFFTGGEPLMRPDVLDLLEHARSLSDDLTLEVLTNGILIKGEVAERLVDLVDTVTISIDGHESHLHEHFRGKNTFLPTVRGIRNLVEVREKRGTEKPHIALVPALTDKNIGFLKEIFEFALDDLGADFLAPIIFQAGDHQKLSLEQIPMLEEWNAAQERLVAYLDKRRKSLSVECEPAQGIAPRNHCGVGHGEFSIDPSGFVYPCQSLHFDEFLCGNIRETDIQEIFDTSPVMRQVRGMVVDRIDACLHCDLKNLCNGGCRATAYNVYRRFDALNEIYCRHLEKIAIEKMWGSSDIPVESHVTACA